MLLALLLLCQDKVELKEFGASYVLTKPAAYTDHSSWPVIWDLRYGKPVREPDAFVITPVDRMDEAFVQAALADVKSKYRVNPERVIAVGNHTVIQFVAGMSELFAGIAVYFPRSFPPPNKAAPCVFFLSTEDNEKVVGGIAAAMIMKKRGIDVELREWTGRPGAILEALSPKIHPKVDLPKADQLQRAGRYLDASLLCIDLLDDPEFGKLAQTKLKSIEGAAIMELAKVEIAMADKKYKDAILRCREAARQFAWVPPGERIRKRLAELERRPEILRALETED